MIAAEYALPIPGSASSSSALAELMSSRSDLAIGAILSDLALWAMDGEAASKPKASALAANVASVKRRILHVSQDGFVTVGKLASNSERRHGRRMNGGQ